MDITKKRRIYPGDVPQKHKQIIMDLTNRGIAVYADGTLVITRREKGKAIKMAIADIQAAIRQCEHMIDGYEDSFESVRSEMSELNALYDLSQDIIRFFSDWHHRTDVSETEAKLNIENIIEKLRLARNEHKVTAKEVAETSTGFRDTLDRLNPSATSAKIAHIANLMVKRFEQLRRIIPRIAARKQYLALIEVDMERSSLSIRNFLTEISQRPAWEAETAARDDLLKLRNVIMIVVKDRLPSLWIAPYRAKALAAKDLLWQAADAVYNKEKNRTKAKGLLLEAIKALEPTPAGEPTP